MVVILSVEVMTASEDADDAIVTVDSIEAVSLVVLLRERDERRKKSKSPISQRVYEESDDMFTHVSTRARDW